MANKKWGFHSGTLKCQDAKIQGDCYVQDDIVFSDVSAGTLGITGGIDMQSTSSAIGIDLGGTHTTAAINIDGTLTGRAIRIGTKDTGLQISTTGFTLDQEPSNNYLFGLFTKVSEDESTSSDELRSAWIRTRVDDNITIGTATGWGYGVCGAEVQLKSYGATINSWQASALWAQLESQGTTTTFASGCYASCVLANVGLTATTVIADGAVAAGVIINSNTSASGVTATGGFYGLYITQKNSALKDFTSGIYIASGSCTSGIDVNAATGIDIGTCTTGIDVTGPVTRGIRVGTHDWGVGSTGLTVSATDPLFQVAGKVTTDAAAGVYASTYSQLAVNITQTHGSSYFASWNELYVTGGTIVLTGTDHYAGVWGHVEVAGTVTSGTGMMAGMHASGIIPNGYTNNGVIAGIYADLKLGTSYSESGVTALFYGTKGASEFKVIPYGLYLLSDQVTTGIYIGDTAGAAIHFGTGTATTTEGDLWYDSSSHVFKYYNGSAAKTIQTD